VVRGLVAARPCGILILCTFRPDYAPPWAAYPSVRSLPLEPLDEMACNALYRELGGAVTEVGVQIAERSGGNPLFIEELALHSRHRANSKDSDIQTAIPSSLSGLLLQRVDRLSPKARDLLRAASVAGQFFSLDLVMQAGPQRDLAVSELMKSGLLVETSDSNNAGFKHALVQDAVYESLLKADRKRLHAKIAHRLEDTYYNREREVAEELSRHYQIAEEVLPAAKYAFHAGEKALELFALRDAATWFDRCLNLYPLEVQPGDELIRARAVNHRMQVHCWDARFDEMLALGGRELDRLRKIDNEVELSHLLAWLGEAYLHNWRYQDSSSTLSDALHIAERTGDQQCIGHVLAEMTWLGSITGKPSQRDHFETLIDRLLGIAERQKDRMFATFALYSRWACAAHEGRLLDMRQWAEDLLSVSRETGYPPALSWGQCMLAFTEASSGNLRTAMESCRVASEAAECAFDRLASDLCKALCLQECGDAEGAAEEFEKVGRPVSEVGSFYFGYASNIARARSMANTGRFDASSDLLTQLIASYRDAGNFRAAAMAMATLGEMLTDSDPNRADELLSEAIILSKRFAMYGLRAKALAHRGALARRTGELERSNVL